MHGLALGASRLATPAPPDPKTTAAQVRALREEEARAPVTVRLSRN